jgi:hypothetical protein
MVVAADHEFDLPAAPPHPGPGEDVAGIRPGSTPSDEAAALIGFGFASRR